MSRIRLIATDLDGTLLTPGAEYCSYIRLFEILTRLRSALDTKWVICSGRGKRSFLTVWRPMLLVGLRPDFVILRGAFVYRRTRMGYQPHWKWNLHIRGVLHQSVRETEETLPLWRKEVEARLSGAKATRLDRDYLRMHFPSRAACAEATALLRHWAGETRAMLVLEYARDVEVLAIPSLKGLSVSELANHLGVPGQEVLAIGNGYNDISMMDRRAAFMTGCTANAEPELMEVVHERGGHIARNPGVAGVIEVIEAYAAENVSSELPPQLDAAARAPVAYTPRRHRQHRHRPRLRREAWLFLAAVGTCLSVLAHFGVLPGSRILAAPVRLLLGLIGRATALF